MNRGFASTLKYYKEFANKGEEETKAVYANIQEKVQKWTERFGQPELAELLKLNELLHVPVTIIPGADYSSPAAISNLLSQYVIDQEAYTRALGLSFHIQNLKMGSSGSTGIEELPKNTIMVAGPSGSGKTLGLQVLRNLFGVDLEIVNCANLVQSGIIGDGLTDFLTKLHMRNKNSNDKMKYAIVGFDEFDKLFNPTAQGYYDLKLQNEFLSLIDDQSEVSYRDDFSRYSSTAHISTTHMMFVFSGSWQNLPNTVAQRLNAGRSSMGFKQNSERINHDTSALYENATMEDYKTLGVKNEILGRISQLTYVRELSETSVLRILNNQCNSPLNQYARYFFLNNIQLNITEDANNAIAEYVVKRCLGARGIRQVLQSVLHDEMFTLAHKGKTLTVNEKYVESKLN